MLVDRADVVGVERTPRRPLCDPLRNECALCGVELGGILDAEFVLQDPGRVGIDVGIAAAHSAATSDVSRARAVR